MLCNYKDIFGEVGKGSHSLRIANIAIVDVIATVISAFLLHRYAFPSYEFYQITFGLFICGIILHRLFCVRTTVDTYLFGS